jgi:hypothetical protein
MVGVVSHLRVPVCGVRSSSAVAGVGIAERTAGGYAVPGGTVQLAWSRAPPSKRTKAVVQQVTGDSYSPIRGKCVWWREVEDVEDRFDINVKPADKRVDCSCFVEGYQWVFPTIEVPPECPRCRGCRYYVKGY